ncbi:uncharacterized protein Dwil_GK17339 [Drosophila willistoni]|uniref:Odorant receptor n=1 Tax=Drosophila willistoni TaxID=7260 RepID=B4MM51_DROWI|nr:odorant receptor 65a [Drosophila willistoni]EDW73060.1 uncharacterized protein Dwil_GK17339 [Drosophila willistoni]
MNWQRFYEQFVDGWQVLHKFTHPRHMTVYYNREQMKAIWNYMNTEERQLPIRCIWHYFIIVQIYIFFLSLLYGIPESFDSIVDLGEDILWVIAAFFLCFKVIYFLNYADDIDIIIDTLEQMHHEPNTIKRIRSIQREHFLLETGLSVAWYGAMAFFSTVIVSHPLWSAQTLLFHCAYPFELHNPIEHPICHFIILLTQIFIMTYYQLWILYTELFSVHCFSQLAVHFQILCIELRELKKKTDDEQHFSSELRRLVRCHQRILHLVQRVNEVFYAPLILQLFATFALLCLSAFVVMACRDQIEIVIRFAIFMLMTFSYISYWSKFGDMVTEKSHEVALAAYDAYQYSSKSKLLKSQRNLILIMLRAQKPLNMKANPFPAYNLNNCMLLLKQCYTILTVLLRYLD